MADWASLPADLIIRISDHILDTNDLDSYMDFRAVCPTWRSATADPKAANPRDPRFLPRRWAMLDEVHQSDALLFVNLDTGRFVRKDLPLLSTRYFLVAGAAGGLLILAERTAPHAARVLNPFTGSLISFRAPVPPEIEVAAYVIGSSPTLVLVCYRSGNMYWADAEDESFYIDQAEYIIHPLVWMAFGGSIYAAARDHGSFGSLLSTATRTREGRDILYQLAKPFRYWTSGFGERAVSRIFLAESQGEMLVVVKLCRGTMEVFKIDPDANMIAVKDIGSRALFVGDCRCLSVDANMFSSVDANCIYYVDHADMSYDICIYNLKDETETKTVGGAIDSLNPFTLSCSDPPFTVVQLLCCHIFEVSKCRLGWNKMFEGLGADRIAAAFHLEDLLIADDDCEYDEGLDCLA